MILQKGMTELKANRNILIPAQARMVRSPKAYLENLFVRSRNGNADAIAETLNFLSLIHSPQVNLIKGVASHET